MIWAVRGSKSDTRYEQDFRELARQDAKHQSVEQAAANGQVYIHMAISMAIGFAVKPRPPFFLLPILDAMAVSHAASSFLQRRASTSAAREHEEAHVISFILPCLEPRLTCQEQCQGCYQPHSTPSNVSSCPRPRTCPIPPSRFPSGFLPGRPWK